MKPLTIDDLTLLFAIYGVLTFLVWTGVGIGAALRHIVQAHADRVAERMADRS